MYSRMVFCPEESWSMLIGNFNAHNMDKLNIFGNKVPMKISGIKKKEISEPLNLLHKDINWIYSSPGITVKESRRLQCARHAARIVETQGINT
jgi:hypothetical protein